MADRPEDRAQRVERILETGDLSRAMNTLKDEMAHVTNANERASVLRSLKEQNEKAGKSNWTLPSVSIEQSTGFMGFGKKEGEYDVNFNQNVFQRAAFAHPINRTSPSLMSALAVPGDKTP